MSQPLVLIADDNAINQMLLTDLLEDKGLKVEVADNGQAAIDKCKEHSFCLILMDLEMPVLNGHDAVKHIREQQLSFAPIIACSGHEKDGKMSQLKQEGFNGYLQKPIDEDKLKKVVKRFVEDAG